MVIEEKKRKGKGIVIKEQVDGAETSDEDFEESVKPAVTTAPKESKRIINRLYNIIVTMEISGLKPFDVKAILDTGATTCCVNKNAIPSEALEPSLYPVFVNGINSRTEVKEKLKGGMMVIGENRFRIPFTYSFPMNMKDGVEMLIGCNFIRAMQGGLRIEGNIVTFYKNVTAIVTKTETEVADVAIQELDLNDLEYIEIKESVYLNYGIKNEKFEKRFSSLLKRLEDLGYIGNEPLKYWSKNQVTCKLEIINPDLTIQDKPLKHVTPAMQEQFNRHVKALLDIGVIRPSTSRHRTMAIMVNSGTTVDPKTGKETKGKEMMVFNYRTLNDNTRKKS